MRKRSVSVEVAADVMTAFTTIHDYDRRLEWDTLLRRAELLDGAKHAAKGVRSLCVGGWRSGFIPMKTEYISFEPGRFAAVELLESTWFFERFAASIRHEAIGEDRSKVTYIYSFRARPKWLARVATPVIDGLLRREVRKRLAGLRQHLDGRQRAYEPPQKATPR